ncbi:MAG: GspE/PulE family protein [Porticoccaceae bacterium]|nr:GspE/PulE family protein [Porticoccaceae bacterium]
MQFPKGVERTLDVPVLLVELVNDGLLSRAEANRISSQERSREQLQWHPLSYIASLQPENNKMAGRTLDVESLSSWFAEKCGLPLWHIDPLKANVPALTAVMSFEFAKRHNILCVEVTESEVVIATGQPFMLGWLDTVAQVSRKPVRRVVVNVDDLRKYTTEFYALARSVQGAGKQQSSEVRPAVTNMEQLLHLGSLKDPDAQDQHIVRIVDWLFQYAFEQRASDIHIEPRRDKGKVRFRIDGVLHQVYELPSQVMQAMVSRLKILARMNVAERRKPQDGRVKTQSPQGGEVELRLSTLPTAFGEKLVMRIFDPEVLLRSFTDLGLTGQDHQRWQEMVSRPHGIVLVTGPTGSGKTTTLYSTLKQLATEEVNVSTVEDPIEMVVDAFNQTQVQHNIELDFASGIRTLMRQDPDIIMVGEIRDGETADMAIQAALTGHLVLSTLHTNDAPGAITRLQDLGIPAHLLRVTLNGVMAQRLVRLLCPHCKERTAVDDNVWQQLVSPWRIDCPPQVFQPVGCLECRNTGFLGRQGIYEIMPASKALKSAISEHTDIAVLRAQALKEGMRTLRLSGAKKIAAGLTSVEEVLRVTADHDG